MWGPWRAREAAVRAVRKDTPQCRRTSRPELEKGCPVPHLCPQHPHSGGRALGRRVATLQEEGRGTPSSWTGSGMRLVRPRPTPAPSSTACAPPPARPLPPS